MLNNCGDLKVQYEESNGETHKYVFNTTVNETDEGCRRFIKDEGRN